MMLLAEPAGRLLERAGNRTPRGMTVQDRTRLISQLHIAFDAYIHANRIVETAYNPIRPAERAVSYSRLV